MTDIDDIDKLIEFGAVFAERVFNKNGGVPPIWIVQLPDGALTPIPTLWSNTEEKCVMLDALRRLFVDIGVCRYVFMVEAWTVEMRFEPPTNIPVPSEHPDRVEVVMLLAEDDEGGHRGVSRRIIRPDKGKPHLGSVRTRIDMHAGRMTGMLVPKRKH